MNIKSAGFGFRAGSYLTALRGAEKLRSPRRWQMQQGCRLFRSTPRNFSPDGWVKASRRFAIFLRPRAAMLLHCCLLMKSIVSPRIAWAAGRTRFIPKGLRTHFFLSWTGSARRMLRPCSSSPQRIMIRIVRMAGWIKLCCAALTRRSISICLRSPTVNGLSCANLQNTISVRLVELWRKGSRNVRSVGRLRI